MKKKILSLVVVAILVIGVTSAMAQKQASNNKTKDTMLSLPHKVENVELIGLDGKVTTLPYYGEKHILVFYVDPDKHRQNEDFIMEMEEKKFAAGDNIEGFGIINLKDTMFPNAIVRMLARKRTEKNKATIITDEDNIIAKKWGLGDCNNMFVLMLVSREGELVFCCKGEFSEQDKADFIRIVADYR